MAALSPKEVETALRAYEVMVILDPDLEERTVAPSLDTYLNVVRQDGGSVEKVDVWGRRRLAYEIDKKAEGIYAVIDLQAEPATVKEPTSTARERCSAPRAVICIGTSTDSPGHPSAVTSSSRLEA